MHRRNGRVVQCNAAKGHYASSRATLIHACSLIGAWPRNMHASRVLGKRNRSNQSAQLIADAAAAAAALDGDRCIVPQGGAVETRRGGCRSGPCCQCRDEWHNMDGRAHMEQRVECDWQADGSLQCPWRRRRPSHDSRRRIGLSIGSLGHYRIRNSGKSSGP